jgi:hypothetical protein
VFVPVTTEKDNQMATIRKTFGVLAVVSLFWLASCSGLKATPAPTQDPNPIRTEAAATVLAQVSQTLAAEPTDTPFPSPTATFTLMPTVTETATATPVVTITLPGGTPAVVYKNLAQYVSQSVADDTIFQPGETFTMTWRLKNVGNSTWTAGYMLRYFSGETFSAPKEVLLGREVLPGEEVEISIFMKAPIVAGGYVTSWVMADEKRSNFKEAVFLKITVVAPPTNTPTPRPPTPTATPKP